MKKNSQPSILKTDQSKSFLQIFFSNRTTKQSTDHHNVRQKKIKLFSRLHYWRCFRSCCCKYYYFLPFKLFFSRKLLLHQLKELNFLFKLKMLIQESEAVKYHVTLVLLTVFLVYILNKVQELSGVEISQTLFVISQLKHSTLLSKIQLKKSSQDIIQKKNLENFSQFNQLQVVQLVLVHFALFIHQIMHVQDLLLMLVQENVISTVQLIV